MQRTKHSAFTLIELLLVVSIIAILAALMLAAPARVRPKVQSIQCLSNLRQMLMAVKSYQDDFADVFPPASLGNSIGGVPVLLSNYGTYKISQCPTKINTSQEFREFTGLTNLTSANAPYGYDWRGGSRTEFLGVGGYYETGDKFHGVKGSDVVAHTRLHIFGDSSLGIRNANLSFKEWIFFITPFVYEPPDGQWWYGVGGWHESNGNPGSAGRGNMGMDDGHVESKPRNDWIILTDDALRGWNVDDQPHWDQISP